MANQKKTLKSLVKAKYESTWIQKEKLHVFRTEDEISVFQLKFCQPIARAKQLWFSSGYIFHGFYFKMLTFYKSMQLFWNLQLDNNRPYSSKLKIDYYKYLT